jgi:solute carrier family 25 folate transporter 32
VPISSLNVLRSLVNNESPIQSLYRGLTPNLLGNAGSWALFFYFKSIVESQLQVFHNQSRNASLAVDGRAHDSATVDSGQIPLSAADYFLSSLVSGAAITLSTNPIWVLKTRMLSTSATAEGAYPSMWAGAKSIWRYEGIRGFYRGVGIGMLGVSHGAVQFAVYDPLKRTWMRYVEGDKAIRTGKSQEKLSNTATLALSGMAKIIAGTTTYPYQVVRSRLQTYDAEKMFGKGIRGVVRRLWREEGWKGFYRGVGPNVVRVLPATWVTFLVYENVRYYLPSWAE